MDRAERKALLRRGLRLEYATLGWNVVGAIVVTVSALAAGSVALVGFGLDSVVEVFASVVVIWQLRGADQSRERLVLRAMGSAFLMISAYIVVQSVRTLALGDQPQTSPVGIAWLSVTALLMLALAWGKAVTGKALANAVLSAEARVTIVDTYLAVAVLLGLVLNAPFGWWWADSLAALVIVFYAVREAVKSFSDG